MGVVEGENVEKGRWEEAEGEQHLRTEVETVDLDWGGHTD